MKSSSRTLLKQDKTMLKWFGFGSVLRRCRRPHVSNTFTRKITENDVGKCRIHNVMMPVDDLTSRVRNEEYGFFCVRSRFHARLSNLAATAAPALADDGAHLRKLLRPMMSRRLLTVLEKLRFFKFKYSVQYINLTVHT